MNRKITLSAFAAKWGVFGARGFAAFGRTSEPEARGSSPPRVSRSIRPRPAKPPPASQRNSRRVRPQKLPRGPASAMVGTPSQLSVEIEEFVEIERDERE